MHRRTALLCLSLGSIACTLSSGQPRQEVASLDEQRFSPASGRRGYWKPVESLRRTGAGILLLEPYDPARTPVLFVHGAAGSPRDWSYFIRGLDRSRYQPWLAYYPSGASVEATADLLFRNLLKLHERHRPQRIHLVAHSLGGLVVRAFLARHHRLFPNLKLFVSLSTPWGGEDLASLAPPLLPVWSDLQPKGPFLSTLFQERLPPQIEYHLLFSYQGSRGPIRPNNDGTVTLKSELRVEAQAEAKRIYGFNESHSGILASPEVLAVVSSLLSAADQGLAGAPGATAAAPCLTAGLSGVCCKTDCITNGRACITPEAE